jgi:methylglutaconyl-CoA hydratase
MQYQTLRVEKEYRGASGKIPGVLTVQLNRPDVRNAFNEKVIEELQHVFGVEALQSDILAVVLKGEGPAFCAGGDLNWMKKAIDFSFEENLTDTRALAKMFQTMNECPKPVIGAVHGAAIGGGVGLVSVCDRVIASKETIFSLSEVRLGIVPACIGPFVIAKIGASYARALFMTGERIQAVRAREMGLVHDVVERPEDLAAEVENVLKNILACGPNAMASAKKLVIDLSWPEKRNALGNPLEFVAQMLSKLRISDEGQEGVKAFLEKRKPRWLR